MNQQLLVLIPESVLAFFLGVAFVISLAANIHDIRQAAQRMSIRKMQPRLRRVRKPAISVIVFAKNNADTIENCLEGIRKNRYPHFDVVVADDSSTDDTRQVVRSYIKKHPHFPIRLYSKRRHTNKSEALMRGYDRSWKGDLVFTIDATDTISESLLRDSAARFICDNKLEALHFNVNNSDSDSITLLYYRFLQLSRSLLDKFLALISKYRVNSNMGGSMYRRAVFRSACGLSVIFGKYSSDLVITDHSVSDDKVAITNQLSKANNTTYYLIFAIFTILLQTYSMYLAATLQSSLILIIGWLAAALWLLIASWSSEALKTKDKITLSFCAPFVYFLVYLQLVIYVIFITTTAMAALLKKVAREFVIAAMVDVR
ncbi:MAG TPA: glycosyltransferase family 2 protein [Candidatus Saccharimonadales bacterium]|nr:glycosyltransferase family 2 protein [Candidatus Saccharimonadales bacterium]